MAEFLRRTLAPKGHLGLTRTRLLGAAVTALALAPLAGCGGATPAATTSGSTSASPAPTGSGSATSATASGVAGLSSFSMLGVQFDALPSFVAGPADQGIGGTSVIYKAPGGAGGLGGQIGIGSDPHQKQDADGATALGLQVTKYTDEKINSNAPVNVPGARGHGRVVDLTYMVKDAAGQQHLTRLRALRFVGLNGVGYEVFVRSTVADFDAYLLGQVLTSVRAGTAPS